ncbi:MAG: MetQ/NlpA family ABC transporter substrate-binding protein [Eubacteriaceae bacterium]
MKKLLSVLLIGTLGLALLTGCGAKTSDAKTITVGASPTPHSEILAAANDRLNEAGYTLVVKEFTDYVQPNLTLASKELDANFFQHLPYLEDFNVKNSTDLVSAGSIHYEPLGLYPGKIKTLDAIVDGTTIAVPNDTTNEARALLLLETLGLIKLDPKAGLEATPKDIIENPKNIQIKELEAAQLARSLQDVDLAVINGNYALQADLNVDKDAIAKEEKESLAAQTYANIIAVRAGEETSEKTKALLDALKSDEVKNYIEETYKGSVVPMF